MEDFIRQYFEYVNNEEFDRILEMWHEHGELSAPLQRRLRGKAEIRTFYEALPLNYSTHEDQLVDYILGGNRIAVRVLVNNTTHDGKAIKFEAISWMAIEDGRIKSIDAFFDSAKILRDMKG